MDIEQIFNHCKKLTMSKRHDYTSVDDNHENFKRSSEIQGWFKSDMDKPYAVLIGTKLARLATLLDSKEPKNESIEDSFLDLINYCALWAERRLSLKSSCPVNSTQYNPAENLNILCNHQMTFNKGLVRCILSKDHYGMHSDGISHKW